jgi:D-sedoheptulose 7-phosphate isomerase
VTVDAGGLTALYPFLYSDAVDDEATLEHLRASTVAKLEEIAALRREVIEANASRLVRCAAAMAERFSRGGHLLAFGNGGSSTDAAAVVATLSRPGDGRRALPAISLAADAAVVTALANDVGVDAIFSRQLAAVARADDIALALSTSGGSQNVVAAVEQAKRMRLLTVAMAGYDGGRLAGLTAVDFLFVVPSASVHRIQEAQTTLYHLLCRLTRQAVST